MPQLLEKPAFAIAQIAAARRESSSQASVATAEKRKRPSYRVLVVEDDAHIARLIEVNLQRAGLDSIIAADGLAGVSMFQAQTPHLVLLDLLLPGMDGFAVCERIRTQSQVPIVIMTARLEPAYQMRGFRAGADDYVLKPFDPQLLVARIIAHLRRVYRYDNGQIQRKPSNGSSPSRAPEGSTSRTVQRQADVLAHMPEGWAGCSACNYIGPLDKFPRLFNGHDGTALSCPHCGAQGHINFAVPYN